MLVTRRIRPVRARPVGATLRVVFSVRPKRIVRAIGLEKIPVLAVFQVEQSQFILGLAHLVLEHLVGVPPLHERVQVGRHRLAVRKVEVVRRGLGLLPLEVAVRVELVKVLLVEPLNAPLAFKEALDPAEAARDLGPVGLDQQLVAPAPHGVEVALHD